VIEAVFVAAALVCLVFFLLSRPGLCFVRSLILKKLLIWLVATSYDLESALKLFEGIFNS